MVAAAAYMSALSLDSGLELKQGTSPKLAEPFIDEIMSGHNLRSLEEFARALPGLG